MNEQALLVIEKILENNMESRGGNCLKRDKISFTDWALEELLLLVWDHPFTLASKTIGIFAAQMEEYESAATLEIQKRIFSIAADTAWKVLEEIQLLEII